MNENEFYDSLKIAKNILEHGAVERTNHKYIDRKYVNGKYVYIYPDDKPQTPSHRTPYKDMYEQRMRESQSNNLSVDKTKANKGNTNKDKMVDDVIRGKYGNGADRKKALGKNYNEVQNAVNKKLQNKKVHSDDSKNVKEKASNKSTNNSSKTSKSSELTKMVDDVIRGKYGNGADRKKALGKNYAEVQKAVNEKLSGKSSASSNGKSGYTNTGKDISDKHRSKKVKSFNTKKISKGKKKAKNVIRIIKYGNGVYVPVPQK